MSQECPKHFDPSCSLAQPFGKRLKLGNSPAFERLKARQEKKYETIETGGRRAPSLVGLQTTGGGKSEGETKAALPRKQEDYDDKQ